jgi:hypothetical protein
VPPQNNTSTPDVRTVLADDNFKQLPLNEKNKVLMRIDPNFAGLAAQERQKVLMRIQYPDALPTPPSTGATVAREGALGLLSGASGLPETEHPVRDAVKGLTRPPSPTEMFDPTGGALSTVIGMGKNVYRAGKEIYQGAKKGDPGQTAHGVGSLAGQAGQFALGAKGGPEAAGADIGESEITGAARAVESAGDRASEAMVRPTIARSVRKVATEERYGHNPERAIVREGVTNSAQAAAKMDEVGQAIDRNLIGSVNQTVNIEPMVRSAADKAIAQARRSGETGAIPRIESARDALLSEYGDLNKSPRAAAEMFRNVRKDVKFGPDPERNLVSQFKKDVSSAISGDVKAKSPGVAELMDRYGDLAAAFDDMQTGERRRSMKGIVTRTREGAEVYIGRKAGQALGVGKRYKGLPKPPEPTSTSPRPQLPE